ELGRQRLQLLHPRAVQAHGRAGGVKRAHHRLADAAGCAGDERLAASQVEHGGFLSKNERIANRDGMLSLFATPYSLKNASISAGPPTFTVATVRSMRRARPDSTLPA